MPILRYQFENDYLGSNLFTEKVNTLFRAKMEKKKSKVNKCPKMPTDDKYWKLISKIAIVLGAKFSQK